MRKKHQLLNTKLTEGNDKNRRAARAADIIHKYRTNYIPFQFLYPTLKRYRNILLQQHWESSSNKWKNKNRTLMVKANSPKCDSFTNSSLMVNFILGEEYKHQITNKIDDITYLTNDAI